MRNDENNTAVAQPPANLSASKQELLAKWLRGGAANPDNAGAGAIPRRHGSGPIPLSLEQQRLWFFYQLEPRSPLYTMPIASRLRGALQPGALQQAMDLVVVRHEALRTRFVGHEPAQTVDAPSSVPMLSIDLRSLLAEQRETEAKRFLEAEAKRPFDLAHDLMIRAALVRMRDEEWVFLVLMHHVASDDWSWRVFCSEVATAYEAIISGRKADLPEPAVQYGDFSEWQQQLWCGDVLEKHLAYWRKQLDGAPPVLELPTDHLRPASQTFRGSCEWLKLSPALNEKVNDLGRRRGATPFMILLAAFQTLLHRYTGQQDVVIGSPVAGRTRASLEQVVGCFVNMLVMRTGLEGNPTFSGLLGRTQTTVLEALAQQELPFEKLVAELQPQRSASYSPLVQVMFALQDELSENLRLPGIVTAPFALDTHTAKFDLTFTLVKSGAGLDCCAEYNSDLFEAETARRMLAHYERMLESIVADPEQRLSDLSLLAEEERNQLLVDWNRTEMAFSREKCVQDLFVARAAATPEAIAVTCRGQSFTYRELNRRANQLAHYLKRLGCGPETLVAISTERSLEMMVALLGTLKAGGAYVPLDRSYPAERIRFMLEDSKAPLLLASSGERERVAGLQDNLRTVCLDTDWSLISKEPDDEPHVEMTPDNLAYVIYTSGSTGRPKGVQIPHRAVVNFLHSMRREPGLSAADTLVSVTSISFDIAALEIFLPLTVGARVVLASADEVFDAAKMKALIRNSGATVMQATPSFWQFLVDSGWRGGERLKILCGGEALSRELANELLERGVEVWNLYGPTETTIWSTLAKLTPGREPVSIGRPIANTQIYLLDSHLQPVPIGVPGELHIGGEGVARGYLDRPDLTAEKFISNPINARLYKTGDFARYRPNGTIECLGRTDSQVKLRGHRIDLGEIESTLRQHPGVREAAVLLREDEPGQKRLVAYLITPATASPDTGDLQQCLKARLPDYMVPGVFVVLEKFPLTPNGKIDRKALPAPLSGSAASERSFTPPGTPTEETLAQIWRELLRLPRVGIHDNFFEIGGHSLLAMQLLARLRDAFQAELSLRSIFEAPTIAAMAGILERNENQSTRDSVSPVPRARRILPGHAKDLLGKLDELSDAEVESLLQQVPAEPGE